MVTAHDYPSAVLCEKANVDIVLVGDSLGMVALGYDSTVPVTMDV
jgi:3-methyl-2-oxobutanoate hydroxymethyltransferase